MTDTRKYLWLRRQLIVAAAVHLFFVFGIYTAFFLYSPYSKGNLNYFGFLLGLMVSSFLSSRVFPNPIHFSPIIRRTPLVMDEDEAELYLKRYWRKLPRLYSVICCFLFGILSSFVFLLPAENAHQSPFGTFILGLMEGYFLCFCTSDFFLLWQLRRPVE